MAQCGGGRFVKVEYLPPPPIPYDATDVPTRLVFGNGIIEWLGHEIRASGVTGRAFVVADEAVAKVHGATVGASLAVAGLHPQATTFPAGEASKSLETAGALYAWLASHRAERRDCIVALGGGVAGDLGGFVAATWLRGVPLVQVPTTVLAMVDSSVGGKTAVNLPSGKNLVGAFHPPVLTCIDVQMIRGLPKREVRAGWAEAIKTAAIFDPPLLATIAGRDPTRIAPDELAHLLEVVVGWKERTVYSDPRERGVRVVLNFGHTIAHAVEATAGYGAFLHGEAVAIGMIAATRLSVLEAGLERGVGAQIEVAIKAAGLPVRLDTNSPSVDAILTRTGVDKKVEAGRVRWVLLRAVGRVVVTDEVDPKLVRYVLEGMYQ
jgi:3-dehydroquinate synthase